MKLLLSAVVAALVLVSGASSARDFTLRPTAHTAKTVTFSWPRQPRRGRVSLPPQRRSRRAHDERRDDVDDVLEGLPLRGVGPPRSEGRSRHDGRERGLRLGQSDAHSADACAEENPPRVRPRAEPEVLVARLGPDEEDSHIRVGAATRRRRIPVRPRRRGRRAHTEELGHHGNVLEGLSLRGGRDPPRVRQGEGRDPDPPRGGVQAVDRKKGTVGTRLPPCPEDRFPAPARPADQEDGDVQLEAAAGSGRISLPPQRDRGSADVRPVDEDRDLLEGKPLHGRGAPDRAREARHGRNAGARVHDVAEGTHRDRDARRESERVRAGNADVAGHGKPTCEGLGFDARSGAEVPCARVTARTRTRTRRRRPRPRPRRRRPSWAPVALYPSPGRTRPARSSRPWR